MYQGGGHSFWCCSKFATGLHRLIFCHFVKTVSIWVVLCDCLLGTLCSVVLEGAFSTDGTVQPGKLYVVSEPSVWTFLDNSFWLLFQGVGHFLWVLHSLVLVGTTKEISSATKGNTISVLISSFDMCRTLMFGVYLRSAVGTTRSFVFQFGLCNSVRIRLFRSIC